jgi:hypothetical protein
MAFGKTVTVRTVDADRYGRTVAEVILTDGRNLSREMVRQGMAWWYSKYSPGDDGLKKAEAEARTAKRGLWSQPNPVTPWDWRHGKDVPVTVEVIGNHKSHVYHAPHCRGTAVISEKNRVAFKKPRRRISERPGIAARPKP